MSSISSPESITTLPTYLAHQSTLAHLAEETLAHECTLCTHALGHIKQEVYYCSHCDAGVCYSCHIMCHSTHEIVEMGMRRGWKCDCGTNSNGNLSWNTRVQTPVSRHLTSLE
jgi:E3 ubiquitin-protein ligase UBR7